MPANENIAPIQQSGSANVPLGESTGSQYQAAPYSEITTVSGFQSITDEVNAIETASITLNTAGSGYNPGGLQLQGFAPSVLASGNNQLLGASISGVIPAGIVIQGIVAQSGVGVSGWTGNQAATIFASGGSNATGLAANSGLYGPQGYFTIQVLGISGNPYMKVPFFNI
jgi:hypothetical protein